jgi:hypothetical protein
MSTGTSWLQYGIPLAVHSSGVWDVLHPSSRVVAYLPSVGVDLLALILPHAE